jgi:hypothetical protein
MKTETSRRPGQRSAASMLMPTNFDEMTVAEFLDYVRWWTTLPSTDRQLLLAARNETRH